jgi:predicted DCC family thiol-disulfide oxidoreductase YuxK
VRDFVITVFYDGKCGLCRREIEYYKQIAPEHIFAWHDITVMPTIFVEKGYAVKDGLKALHVEDDKGIMHIGVAGFVVIWKKLPRLWPVLAFILRIPFLMPVMEKLYSLFAAWRFKKLGYDKCDL